ncbi:MAG: glycosyltransferase family 4 protein [Isosphaeraceae bacterium]
MPDPAADCRPLRVGYLIAYFYPFESGAERQALLQGEELARLGHEVHVATHWVPGVEREATVRGIHVHRWIGSSKRGPLFAPSFVASAARALRRLRRKVDLIHTHQALWEAVAAGFARKIGWLGGVPTVIQPASSGYYGEAEELRRTRGARVLRSLATANDAFVAISADIERQWLDLGVPAERMTRIASGVDHRHYSPGPSRLESELLPRPRVVFTGRLHPQKNLDLLLDAWPAVAAQTAANLVLVGQGPERARLEEKVERLGVSGRVQFTGALPDVAEALRAADVFVLPSVAEGMSNSLLEAMATGLPCVASRIGGNEDLLGPGGSGLLIDEATPGRWSEKLVELLNDQDLRARLGASARLRVEDEFALEKVVGRYVELYRRLLASRTKSETIPAG